MSEMINNREYRQKILKELIMELHNGKGVDEVKPRFEKLISGISAKEISEMEQALIMDGMPVEQIQELCDVHAAVFKGSIEEIHRPQKPEEAEGHPVNIFKLENIELDKIVKDRIKPHLESYKNSGKDEDKNYLLEDLSLLWEIDKHYSRKENLLFPFMEKYGITAPPKVMWGVDDEIRDAIKEGRVLLSSDTSDKGTLVEKIDGMADKVIEMIFKEESILFPMVLETLSEDEWAKIAQESDEIGYTIVKPKTRWIPENINKDDPAEDNVQPLNDGYIKFDAGLLTPEQANAMLNTLPVDITFVDKNGAVKYFTQGKERIFSRPKTIIGRQVENCHPPASVHIVEKIVEDLKAGIKDNEDFWIKMGEKYVYIRYFAVRNEQGEFLGIMEVTQDIKPIQSISGEKRLISQ
ncbi:hemerythrin HHE cation binding domain protein [Oxobacter pfennigii]|uniref:Hemerythrin HHE cation binding domain protein n=1 Tax=Oxobacter pfennigii TaxID=36849 RepID=A0A0P8Z087_9CLOT|nr:DUF438 domain-containing protein [Oxobacter pfennigii]KPU45550.1 hemerythrin HHE cation binding domain protein [Oxobacter pfennigii]